VKLFTGSYIDGRWCASSDGTAIAVGDPATGEVVAEVATASTEDCVAAVAAAETAALAAGPASCR
jgi:acyl-CoA reductase-like NAD-dependent aldehyde dehydrogenase